MGPANKSTAYDQNSPYYQTETQYTSMNIFSTLSEDNNTKAIHPSSPTRLKLIRTLENADKID